MKPISLVVIALFLFVVPLSYAQTFEQNQKIYSERIAEIDAESEDKDALDQAYLAALDNLIETYRRQVDFEAVQALREERERFNTTKEMGEVIPQAKDIQERYAASFKRIEEDKARRKAELSQRYIAILRRFLAQAMHDDDMDEAARINAEIRAVESGVAVSAANQWQSLVDIDPRKINVAHKDNYFAISSRDQASQQRLLHRKIDHFNSVVGDSPWIFLHPTRQAPASIEYVFDNPVNQFSAVLFVLHPEGDAAFSIYGDDKLIDSRHVPRASDGKTIFDVNLGGVKELRLEVGVGTRFVHTWAVWIDPKVR